jgi:hypothetical protein
MRVLRNFFTVFISFSSFAQSSEVSNFYFTEPQPVEESSGSLEVFQGLYRMKSDTNQFLKVWGDTMVSNMFHSIQMPTTEFDANVKWMKRNGYIHGVVRNDSLPYVQHNDTLLFVIPYKTTMFSPSEDMICRRLNDRKVVLNFKESTDKWTCMVLEKTDDNQLIIYHLDHDAVEKLLPILGKIAMEPGAVMPTKLVSPKGVNFIKFVDKGGFDTRKMVYQPVANLGG